MGGKTHTDTRGASQQSPCWLPTSKAARIAASALFGSIALLLCALWVRSYWGYDVLSRVGRDGAIIIGSNSGEILWRTDEFAVSDPPSWLVSTWPPVRSDVATPLPFRSIPYWLPASVATCLAAAPLALRRFTMRTLLAAMTVAAVLLAALAASLRA